LELAMKTETLNLNTSHGVFITSTAEREAAVEFAKAEAIHPKIVGAALDKISRDPEIADAVFRILENQRLLQGHARVTLVPNRAELLTEMLAADSAQDSPGQKPPVQGQVQTQGKQH
jgi:hypothetical protein